MRIGMTNRVGAAAVAVAAVFFGMGKQATGSGLPPAGVLGHAGVMSSAMTGLGQSYVLHLHHLHTDESLDIVYRVGQCLSAGCDGEAEYVSAGPPDAGGGGL